MDFATFTYRTRREISEDGERFQRAALEPGLGSPRSAGEVDEDLCGAFEAMLCQEALEKAFRGRMHTLLVRTLDRIDPDWLTFTYESYEAGPVAAAWCNGPKRGDVELSRGQLRSHLGDRLLACIARPGIRIALTNRMYTTPVLADPDRPAIHTLPALRAGVSVLYGFSWVGLVESTIGNDCIVRRFSRRRPVEQVRFSKEEASRFLRQLTPSEHPQGILHAPFRFPEGWFWRDLAERSGTHRCESQQGLALMLADFLLDL